MSKGLVGQHPDLDTRSPMRSCASWARRGAPRPARHRRDHRPASPRRRRAAALHARQGAPRRARLRGSDRQERLLLGGQELAAWVMFKLDRGIDHILVDEAQDTSPEQWQIVKALASEFFGDTGARERRAHAVRRRRREAVDLQLPGRRPRAVRRHGQSLRRHGRRRPACTWQRIPLDLSFRTVDPRTCRGRQRVCRPPPHARPDDRSRDRAPRRAPLGPRRPRRGVADRGGGRCRNVDAVDAARRSCRARAGRTVGRAHRDDHPRLARQRRDAGLRGPAHHRRRHPDPGAQARARLPVPWSAPSRRAASTSPAPTGCASAIRSPSRICLSLGDFLTLPEDDLALAEVLKSPLIGFDDNDLMALAAGRKGTLWKSLIDHADDNPRYRGGRRHAEALALARRLCAAVRVLRLDLSIARAAAPSCSRGSAPEAADPIDEFLNLALSYDDELAAVAHRLSHLPARGRPRGEARHGARPRRGARDDRARRQGPRSADRVPARYLLHGDRAAGRRLLDADGMERPAAPTGRSCGASRAPAGIEPSRPAKAAANARETEERNRLLYVAMTRARDRLYIAGFEGKNGPSAGCWYELITGALGDTLQEAESADGRKVRRARAADRRRRERATARRSRAPPADAAALGSAPGAARAGAVDPAGARRASKPTRRTRPASRSIEQPPRTRARPTRSRRRRRRAAQSTTTASCAAR